jgi:hypothetical protein
MKTICFVCSLFVLVCGVANATEIDKPVTTAEYKEGFEKAIEKMVSVERALYRSDMVLSVGRHMYGTLLEEVRQLRKENTIQKKQLQSARDYLERLNPPAYISDITGTIYNEVDPPLYREKVLRQTVEEKLKRERDDRALDIAAFEAKISKLNRKIGELGAEREELTKQLQECRTYFKSLKDKGIVK